MKTCSVLIYILAIIIPPAASQDISAISSADTAYMRIIDGRADRIVNPLGYLVLLPELNEEQKRFILSNHTEARELAMDKGSSEEKHEVFREYKGRINNYPSKQGYDIKKTELELKKRERPKDVCSQTMPGNVSGEVMNRIYEEIKSPFKYGLVLIPSDSARKIDCPTVFRHGRQWYMTYLVYDGRGYETWLAKSRDLLNWETMGKILSFSDSITWDEDQKAGYPSLQDHRWGGTYKLGKYRKKYWMSYFGGSTRGYERGLLSAGIAWTGKNPATVHEWQRLDEPVLMASDSNARWWENNTIFKSSVICDKSKLTGYPFVMFYNARGDSINPGRGAERIGMAVSEDMVHWIRFGNEPVIDHHNGISGDAVIQKTGKVWIMFYFGAFWPTRKDAGAFNRFACSYDLLHWTEWEGEDLIAPSEPYDNLFAHKSSVVNYRGVVYHFYCAVNKNEDRGIALATSVDLGKSNKHFNH
jgi:predicted GH43/DUF377 family glycosyl hydrolase